MLGQLWRYRSLVLAFVNRDLATRYRSSVLGWAWSLANPLATLVIFSIVFSALFHMQAPPRGNGHGGNYAAFVFTGIVTWNLFAQSVRLAMSQLVESADLLRKVHFPPWAPVMAGGIVQLVQVLLEFSILLLMLLALRNVGWTMVLSVPILLGLFLFAQGVGLAVAILNARLRDTEYVVLVALGTLYFLTPVLYPLSAAVGNGKAFSLVLMLNPVTWYVQGMHDVMYSLVAPPLWSIAALLLGGALTFWAGLAIFDRASRDIVEVI